MFSISSKLLWFFYYHLKNFALLGLHPCYFLTLFFTFTNIICRRSWVGDFFSVCHDLVYANCPYQNTILLNHQTPESQADQFLNFRFYLFLGPDQSCHSWFFLVLNDKYHVFFWNKTEIFYMQLRALTWFVEFSLY